MYRVMLFCSVVPLMFGVDCFLNDNVPCTLQYVYGLNVTLTDATTSEPIGGATLILMDGGYSETLQESAAGQYLGAGERPGTYELTIEASGYASESRNEIVVTADECHVHPVSLSIALTPAP